MSNGSDVDLDDKNLDNAKFVHALADTIDILNKQITNLSDIGFKDIPTVLSIIEQAKNLFKELKEITLYDDINILNEAIINANTLINLMNDKLDNNDFQGLQGDSFKYDDFTDIQLLSLKGDSFKYEDFTDNQLSFLKGLNGNDGSDGLNGADGNDGNTNLSFIDLTPEQVNSIRGLNGLKGDSFKYSDFTASQLLSLNGTNGTNGNDGTNGTDGSDGVDGVDGSVQDLSFYCKKDYINSLNFSSYDTTVLASYPARKYNGIITLSESLFNFEFIIVCASYSSGIYITNQLFLTSLMDIGKNYQFWCDQLRFSRWVLTNDVTFTYDSESSSRIHSIFGLGRK